ncbi:hypothetical protein PR048_025165 [Dryococelus australis]|uniref:Uncharacterized protein n=1 Tax=Dryococelus australis TaxID=614101 RepID=A0ABQ9GQP6_9NEOP|nr:hypothetical protein PR048_025165 [Dryococelus australis]
MQILRYSTVPPEHFTMGILSIYSNIIDKTSIPSAYMCPEDEVEMYLAEPPIPINSNPLHYWKTSPYTRLRKAAQKYQSSPAGPRRLSSKNSQPPRPRIVSPAPPSPYKLLTEISIKVLAPISSGVPSPPPLTRAGGNHNLHRSQGPEAATTTTRVSTPWLTRAGHSIGVLTPSAAANSPSAVTADPAASGRLHSLKKYILTISPLPQPGNTQNFLVASHVDVPSEPPLPTIGHGNNCNYVPFW